MFSGKSEELIRRVRRCYFAKQNVVVFKPKIDNRYSKDEVVSHNGEAVVALPIKDASEIYTYITKEVEVIAVDEAQFFDENIIAIAQDLANDGYRVILAGLDQDFRGESFGPMPELLALAEQITKLHAVCSVCGSHASRTQRLINHKPASYYDPVIMVGASESYEPRCRHHHEVPDTPVKLEEKVAKSPVLD